MKMGFTLAALCLWPGDPLREPLWIVDPTRTRTPEEAEERPR